MARDESDERKLTLDDRPTVGQVIAITKQILYEERWYRRLGRAIGRLLTMDWAGWRFRQRMRLARIRNESPASIKRLIEAEATRVAAIAAAINKGQPREQHVRGKVYLPLGAFISAPLEIPDSVDVVWPRRRTR